LEAAADVSSSSEARRVFVVWVAIAAYFALVFLAASRTGSGNPEKIPSSFSFPWAVSIIESALVFFVPIMLLLVYAVRHAEKRSSRSAISSLGLNRGGIGKSVLWSLVFLVPLVLVIILWEGAIAGIFGNNLATAQTQASQIPQWYAVAIMPYLVLNAIMEESVGRGFMLDRLMPSHPAGIVASLPVVLGVSVLGMLYHIPEYILSYNFSPASLILNLGIVFFSFTFVGFAYVRSRVRNISGPVLMHFLLDAVPLLLVL
jgi:membrane protease YdiL (CAAX protease family)